MMQGVSLERGGGSAQGAWRRARWAGVMPMLLIASIAHAQQPYDDYGYVEDGAYAMTRGPVHEAFAEPISFDPEPGPIAPTAPPAPIDEYPPDYRPAGVNVDWIPGYWAWDDEANDFLWVSGIWRDIPPGREWIAGYWIQSYGGYRWIPGYWEQTNQSQTLYLPEPPASVETAPNYAGAPSPDHIWVSGSWIWQGGRYAWRAGYWVPGRQDWIWVPAHYVWTPRGYVFVDGYWDYDLDRRGVLFAPTRFRKDVYLRPQYRYQPRLVIDLRTLTDHLFLRPNHYHYYFGDYFDDRYVNRGFRPWYTAGTSRRVYDPIYAHRRWRNRNDRDWDNRLRNSYDYRRRNVDARPPRSWADQRDFVRNRRNDPNRGRDRGAQGGLKTTIGKTISQLLNRKNDPIKFNPLDNDQRQRIASRKDEIERMRRQREQTEGRNDGKPDERYRTRTVPAKGPSYKSPISSKPAGALNPTHQPPPKPDAPKPDPDVKGQRRVVKKKADDKKNDDRNRDRDRDRERDRDRDRRDKERKKD